MINFKKVGEVSLRMREWQVFPSFFALSTFILQKKRLLLKKLFRTFAKYSADIFSQRNIFSVVI